MKTFKDLLSIVSPARRRVVRGSDVFFSIMSATDELDPSEFVQRIRQLGEQRDQQDAERVRKLEEEIIQGRSERLARRAERARSLSPEKSNTPQSQPSAAATPRSLHEKAAESPTPTMDPLPSQSPLEESLRRLTGSPAAAQEDEAKKPTASAAVAPSRTGTLSWQRRPQSGTRRPLSMAATEKNIAPSLQDTSEPASPEDLGTSRSQIAESLGSKDPSWFKQTADRGVGSAAYRKNQEDNPADVAAISGRRQLPGMSRESTVEPEAASPPPESVRSSSPSRASSVRGSVAWSNRFSTNTSLSGGEAEPLGKAKSPLPMLESQKLSPPPSDQASSVDGGEQLGAGRSMAMSPAQGRISPERMDRPASPTKGLGGFVQSAMLKRSDSMSKRWSAQAAPGLSRQSSTASNRSGVGGVGVSGLPGSVSMPKLDSRPSSLSRGNSMEPNSRPGSSSSNMTITKEFADNSKSEFVKPALPQHSRGKSVTAASTTTFGEDSRPSENSPPPSPSKRWSPTKSSWLESALNKPDSPKPKLPPPQQPAWMAEINKIKQQRSSVDLGRAAGLKGPPAGSPLPPSIASPPSKTNDSGADTLGKDRAQRNSSPPKRAETATPPPRSNPVITSPNPANIAVNKIPVPEKSTPIVSAKEMSEDPLEHPTPKPSGTTSHSSKDSSASTSSSKPRPETPPKKDFRATLKPRQGASDASRKEELEFQNVFGKLKRTQTEKYVPPDELKSNILRGKAGLQVTAGPKIGGRKDELKESLIKQKEAIKAKALEVGPIDLKKSNDPPPAPTTPEALAKRKTLGKMESAPSNPSPVKEKDAPTPEAIARQKSLKEKSKPTVSEKQPEPAPAPAFTAKEAVRSSKLADRFNPALAGMLARGPSPMSGGAAASKTGSLPEINSSSRPTSTQSDGPGPQLQHMTKGRARGPKRRAPAAKEEKSEPTKAAPAVTVPLVKPETILPSNASSPDTSNAAEAVAPLSNVSRTPSRDSVKAKPITPAKSPQLDKIVKPPVQEPPRRTPSPVLERKSSSLEGRLAKPADLPLETESTRVTSTQPAEKWKVGARPLPSITPKPVEKAVIPDQSTEKPLAKPEATRGNDSTPTSEDSRFSVRSATSLWGRQSASSSPTITRSRSPTKLPTKVDEQAAMENVGLALPMKPAQSAQPLQPAPLALKSRPIGLGLASIGGAVAAQFKRESSPPKPISSRYPVSPPLSAGRHSEPFKSLPTPTNVESNELFGDFFDELPVTTGELPSYIDTHQILTSSPFDMGPTGKIRTLRKQILELSGDGKLTPVPMQEEHVLFEECMYLCTHDFGNSKGAKMTEVYLWAGAGVPEGALEDAQLWGRKAAKDNHGKLIILRQGKETPNFFEALGGIVITRRGTRPVSRPYMLCGRRHMGHIAFDEVDFSLKSLCSGFPYVISSNSGTVFLWKGIGCSAEELSGARLIGMDLGSSGELYELDEGSETPEFFEIFPASDDSSSISSSSGSSSKSRGKQSTAAIPRSADHWRYKAGSAKYRARLFKMEQQQGTGGGWGTGAGLQTPQTPKSPLPPAAVTKVTEVAPFCQKDLEPEFVYVLDAFFEIYIIVGALSRTQSAAFSTALLFAQEYGILAASAEDRPLFPVATVVLEGVPRDMKAVFRHWDDALVPAAALMRGKLGRGKSLRIVGLEKALEATRR